MDTEGEIDVGAECIRIRRGLFRTRELLVGVAAGFKGINSNMHEIQRAVAALRGRPGVGANAGREYRELLDNTIPSAGMNLDGAARSLRDFDELLSMIWYHISYAERELPLDTCGACGGAMARRDAPAVCVSCGQSCHRACFRGNQAVCTGCVGAYDVGHDGAYDGDEE